MSTSTAVPLVGSPRHALAQGVVNKYVPWSMGVGLIPFPLLAVGGLIGIQIKMMSDICRVYGQPFSEAKGRSILLSLVGGVMPAALSFGGLTGIVASVPIIGPWLFGATLPLLSGASTYAVGKTLAQHLESGGTFLTFDAPAAKELFQVRFEEGKMEAKKFADKLSSKFHSATAGI